MITVLDDRTGFGACNSPILRGRSAVRAYLETAIARVGKEPFLILYVAEGLDLLSCETIPVRDGGRRLAERIVARGYELEAAAFILVERRKPKELGMSSSLIQEVCSLRTYSAELNMPLLDYFLFDGSAVASVGGLQP